MYSANKDDVFVVLFHNVSAQNPPAGKDPGSSIKCCRSVG
eukprot:COSAG01_NODE_50556_length_362_cov_0.965779_1_plen_39_part_10